MISKIEDDWFVLDININNWQQFSCDTYNRLNFKSVNYLMFSLPKEMIKHNQLLIRNIDLKVYQFKKINFSMLEE